MIRLVTLFKQGLTELKCLVHPQGIFMLTGRLEVYSVLVLLSPIFWRR